MFFSMFSHFLPLRHNLRTALNPSHNTERNFFLKFTKEQLLFPTTSLYFMLKNVSSQDCATTTEDCADFCFQVSASVPSYNCWCILNVTKIFLRIRMCYLCIRPELDDCFILKKKTRTTTKKTQKKQTKISKKSEPVTNKSKTPTILSQCILLDRSKVKKVIEYSVLKTLVCEAEVWEIISRFLLAPRCNSPSPNTTQGSFYINRWC